MTTNGESPTALNSDEVATLLALTLDATDKRLQALETWREQHERMGHPPDADALQRLADERLNFHRPMP